MASREQNIVKNISELSENLLNGDEKALEKLKELVKKGVFYSFNITKELTDKISKQKNVTKKIRQNFVAIIEISLSSANGDKDVHLSIIHNYLVKVQDSSDAIEDFVTIFSKDLDLKLKTPEILLNVVEKLLKFAKTDDEVKKVIKILKKILNSPPNGLINQKILHAILRSISSLALKSNWNMVNDVIQTIFVLNAYPTDSQEVLNELHDILLFITRYRNVNDNLSKSVKSFANEAASKVKDSTYKHAFEAFGVLSEFAMMTTVDEVFLLKVLDKIKNLKKSEVKHQKIAQMFVKLFALKVKELKVSTECLTALHNISINLYHIVACIKSEEAAKATDCCTNTKRHEVINVITTFIQYSGICHQQKTTSANFIQCVDYHMNYYVTIMKSFPCPLKEKEISNFYGRIYNLLYDVQLNENFNFEISEFYTKSLFRILNLSPELAEKPRNDPLGIILRIFENPTNESEALIAANMLMAMLHFSKFVTFTKTREKRTLMKMISNMKKALEMIGITAVSRFIENSKYKDWKFTEKKIPTDELIMLEICAMTRYSAIEDQNSVCTLFEELCDTTENTELIGKCLYLINDKKFPLIDQAKLRKIVKKLENIKEFDIEVSLSIGVGNYFIYQNLSEAESKKLADLPNTIDNMNLQSELEMLKYLSNSQNYFCDVIKYLNANPHEVAGLVTIRRIVAIIKNIGIKFLVRRVKTKEIESFMMLWMIANMEGTSPMEIFNAATFFLDNYGDLVDASGNYVKFSKKLKPLAIEDVIDKAEENFKKEIKSFDKSSEQNQCIILSYLVSLWLFYFKNKKRSNAAEKLKLLKDLWQKTEKSHSTDSREIVRGKLFFSIADAKINGLHRRADDYMSLANGFLMKVRQVSFDFSHQFYQVFQRMANFNINLSLDLQNDLDHYEGTVQSFITLSYKKNYCLKLLEMFSLSILRYLNMEKLEQAKNQLRNFAKMLGISEEISIESPKKLEGPVSFLEYTAPSALTEGIRKAPLAPESPIANELLINVNQSDVLIQQLQSFVHGESCKCETCKYPLFKFYTFQMGCYYARLLFLMGKFDISLKFHQHAIEPWRNICDKIRRMKDFDDYMMINKSDFYVFSIRWLFQYADTLIKSEMYDEIDEIYTEIELIVQNKIPNSECFKETLFYRKDNLSFLQEYHEKFNNPTTPLKELNFYDFLKFRGKNYSTPPEYTLKKNLKLPKIITSPKLKKSPASASVASSSVYVQFKKTTDVKKLKTPSVAVGTKKKVTTPPVIFIDDSDEDQKKPNRVTPSTSSTSSSSASSSRATKSTVKSSKTKITDQTPKTKSSKDEKAPAKRNLRQRMI